MISNPHALAIQEVEQILKTDRSSGLTDEEAAAREQLHGPNALPETKKKSIAQKLLDQIKDVLALILFFVAGFSILIGETNEGVVILVIVIANAVLSLVQEMKADNAIESLKKLSPQNAKVIRSGEVKIIEASHLVPGDIILIESGDRVPGDARLIEAIRLQISESALTGESKPKTKSESSISKASEPIIDRDNMVHKDGIVLYGKGKAIVCATGVNTEIGKIFNLFQSQETKDSKLKTELKSIGKNLTIFAAIASAIIFAILLLQDTPLTNAIITGISIGVAVVPEGIAAVITVVLAISVYRLAKSNAIIRKMDVIESLGAATLILTDKTGTLTKNEMTVTQLIIDEQTIETSSIDPNNPQQLTLLNALILANDSQISNNQIIGDPTENALIKIAQDKKINIEEVKEKNERIFEIPFSSESKRMLVVCKSKSEVTCYAKGAIESINQILKTPSPELTQKIEALASKGLRILAVCSKDLNGKTSINDQDVSSDFTLLGAVCMTDPLKDGVKEAIREAERAGIQTIILTGDHKNIAQSIAAELGILPEGTHVLDYNDITNYSEQDLVNSLGKTRAFSRISPEQKLQITQAAIKTGHTVIVTGDGVNDAPAIKAADIGISMGIAGTDVAKEAADIVLQDDNYATIVTSIKQGRGIYQNFVKFLKYQISSNLSGVLIIIVIASIAQVSPLIPIHILLLNLVSETAPSIALGLDKPSSEVFEIKPRSKHDSVLSRSTWNHIIFDSIALAVSGITAYFLSESSGYSTAITVVLCSAFLSRLWHSFSNRSERRSIFTESPLASPGLSLSFAGTLLILILIVYTNFGNTYLKTTPLNQDMILITIGTSLISLILIEIKKTYLRTKKS